jgi:hypothetical protein
VRLAYKGKPVEEGTQHFYTEAGLEITDEGRKAYKEHLKEIKGK